MSTEKHDPKEAESDGCEETTKEEDNPSLTDQLLRFHDDLNNFLGEQDFYRVSISTLIHSDDCDVLYTERQRTGLTRTGRYLSEKGNELSDRLGAIRKQFGIIGKQLG